MNIQRSIADADEEKKYKTGDLPINGISVSLYKTACGDYVIQKFGKEFPDLYVGVKYVVEELKSSQIKSIVVREGGNGIVPTLVALALPKVKLYVSLWTADRELVDRNLDENIFLEVPVVIEGKVSQKADVGILTHKSFESQGAMIEEIVDLVNVSNTNVAYLISHKNKGAETLADLVYKTTGITYDVVSRGKGGARVIKFCGEGKDLGCEINNNSYSYELAGRSIVIHSGNDAFSKVAADVGSAMLVNYVASLNLNPKMIWDLGCGSGYIGISAGVLFPDANLVLSDINARVIEFAKENLYSAGMKNRSEVVLGNGNENIKHEFDLILSNPPLHISRQQLIKLLTQARRRLSKGGKMLLVIEDSRVDELKELLKPVVGTARTVFSGGSHSILEVDK